MKGVMLMKKNTITENDFQLLKKKRFLQAFSRCGNITQAAIAADIDRTAHYKWLKRYPDYPDQFREATENANDLMTGEAIKRATIGIEEPVFYQGRRVGSIIRRSDILLMFLLKAYKPEVFRDNHPNDLKADIEIRVTMPKGFENQ